MYLVCVCVYVCVCVSNFCLPCARSETTAPALENYENKKKEIIFKDIQNFPFGEMCIHVLQMSEQHVYLYLYMYLCLYL